MELELHKHEIICTGISARNTLEVLPLEDDRKNQRVACGDLSGVVQCFSVKRGEITTAFKTLPSPSQKVTSLALGRGRQQRDRIFYAAGNTIVGISKKGTPFFKFNTQITETISQVNVFNKDLWTAGEYIYNHFIEGVDKDCFLAPDRINAAQIVPVLNPEEMNPILACQDRCIRVLSGMNIMLQASTPAAPVCLEYIIDSHDPHNRFPNAKEVLYGTDAGTLHQLMVNHDMTNAGFTVPNTKKLGAVRAIYSGSDFTKTGVNDIAIARDDGTLEIYDLDEQDNLQQVYSANLNESVNSLDGGVITSSVPELIMQTFSGKVITYSPPGGGFSLPETDLRIRGVTSDDNRGARKAANDVQIMKLQEEVNALRAEVHQEKAEFQSSGASKALLALGAPFELSHSCKLEAEEACYVLNLESSVPIFCVAIQSNIALELLDVPSNVAILSRSPTDPKSGNHTLATYRCQESTARVSIKFKLQEGRSGVLQAFVIPNISPKSCMSVSHKIPLLCLHSRIPSADPMRPTSELSFTGTFSMSDMHNWVSRLLPDAPPSVHGCSEVSLAFTNAVLGTQLACRYSTGEAQFTCESPSTLAAIHEAVMREATASKHRCQPSCQPSSASLRHCMEKLWPKIERQRTLKKQTAMLEGLLELKMQDSDVMSYLPVEYKKLLENAEQTRTDFKEQPKNLEHLVSVATGLYQDFCKLTGVPALKPRVQKLEQTLNDPRSSLDEVLDFVFNSS